MGLRVNENLITFYNTRLTNFTIYAATTDAMVLSEQTVPLPRSKPKYEILLLEPPNQNPKTSGVMGVEI